MADNPLLAIHEQGQSIWIDNLTRDLIQAGELKRLIEHQGIRGITSNPSIFQKAIAGSTLYDADIRAGIQTQKSIQEIYESLIFTDIRNACDIFQPIYESSQHLDGYVSIEVPPNIANDTAATVQEAVRYFEAIGRENVMIKIPGTASGFAAVEQVISQGINVNITLLFSIESYLKAAQSYMQGLEARIAKGQRIDHLASVASFFLSRIDTKVDQKIAEKLKTVGTESLNKEAQLTAIGGKVAIANAKVAYQQYKQLIKSDRWQAIAAEGGKPQRLLWASTSTKNPQYRDVMYVEELIGPETVNTLPPATIEACMLHCDVANRLETNVDQAYQLLESLNNPEIAIDLNQILAETLEEGIDIFVQSFQSLMDRITDEARKEEAKIKTP